MARKIGNVTYFSFFSDLLLYCMLDRKVEQTIFPLCFQFFWLYWIFFTDQRQFYKEFCFSKYQILWLLYQLILDLIKEKLKQKIFENMSMKSPLKQVPAMKSQTLCTIYTCHYVPLYPILPSTLNSLLQERFYF